jgi:hypothetical protein
MEPGREHAPHPTGVARVAQRGALVVAWIFVLTYAAVAFLRLAHPFELEWVEGGAVDQVRRIVGGEPVYVAPSLDYVPLLYTPLYFYVSAGASWLLGEGYLPLRIVSIVSSLSCLVLLHVWLSRETGRRLAGVLAAGFFAGTFGLSGAWFDLGRVDSLMLALLLGALFGLRFATTVLGGCAAGALAAAAVLTKQAALIALGPCLLYACVLRRPVTLAFVGTFTVLVVGACVGLQVASDGWFAYYAFELPSRHGIVVPVLWEFWLRDLLSHVPVAMGLVVAAALLALRGADRSSRSFYACCLLGVVCASWWSRLHAGGYDNVLMPVHAALAVGFAMGAMALDGWVRSTTERAALWILCLLQLVVLSYDPRGQVPDASDLRAGETLLSKVRAFEGDVLVPWHGSLAAQAGKPATAHWMAMVDVLRAGPDETSVALEADIRDAIASRRFAAIIVDDSWFHEDLSVHYELRGPVFEDAESPGPTTGMQTTPSAIWVVRRRAR